MLYSLPIDPGVTFADKLFPKTIIEIFHERIEGVLGPEDMGALKFTYPIKPTCEQPMSVETISDCFTSSSKSTF